MKYGLTFYDAINGSSEFFQKYVDTFLKDKYNSAQWKSTFSWDIAPQPDDTFKQYQVIKGLPYMADVRARFSPAEQRGTEGIDYYQGTIPSLSHGYKESVEDRVRLKRIASLYKGDTDIITQFTSTIDPFIGGVHSRLTNMALQLESKGKIYDPQSQGTGVFFKADAPIPADNFLPAGAKTWTDTTSKIISRMIEIERLADLQGMPSPRVWRLAKSFQPTFFANDEVKTMVYSILYPMQNPQVSALSLTQEQLTAFLIQFGQISPIEWVEDQQLVFNRDGSTDVVHGWDASKAVLRPAGQVGVMKYSVLEELVEVQGQPNISLAYLENGKMGIKRKFNSESETWETSVLCAAVPTLSNWNKYFIVNITQSLA